MGSNDDKWNKGIGSTEFKKNVCIAFFLNAFIAKTISWWLYIWERHYFTCVLCWVAQSYTALCDLVDCSSPGSSVHGDSPGKNTGVDCHGLLQGIFPMQGSNPGLPHCRRILHCLSHQGSPSHFIYWVDQLLFREALEDWAWLLFFPEI